LVGRPWSEVRLLELARSFELRHRARRPPWEVNPAVFRRFPSPA
jgi:hypothetical protein